MKIAIIGSGISGLTCAYYLSRKGHEIAVFEKNDYIGGHTHTIQVCRESGEYAVDTGFIVYNTKTYPCFTQILSDLAVRTEETDMSFGVHSPQNQFQYAGGSLNGLFAYRANLVRPGFYRFILEIKRYHQLAKKIIEHNIQDLSVRLFLSQYHFSRSFIDYYFYPLISALWSASAIHVDQMPIYFIARFMQNHALLKLRPDIAWRVISGGSSQYISALTKDFISKVYLGTPVKKITRTAQGCLLYGGAGQLDSYDSVIIGTHADQALAILDHPSLRETDILSRFSYDSNEVILHTDSSVMPSLKRAWASWNYRISLRDCRKAALTYYMNRLQNIVSDEHFFVSLNPGNAVTPEKIIARFEYAHPQYTPQSLEAQSRQSELNREANHTYYCGAYWGFGFHEDGVRSALAVCKEIENRASS